VRVESASSIAAEALVCIAEIGEAAASEVRQFLPELNSDILLWVRAGTDVIPETGEVGMSLRPGLVEWVVDPDQAGGVLNSAETHLRHTLFHELHHQVRGWVIRGGKRPTSFMDAVIAEGLATVFARDAGGHDAPWAQYPTDVEDWVAEIQSLTAPHDYGHWMFQHRDGRRWIGYRAGTYICDRAVTRSGLSAAELVSETTERVLTLAHVERDQPLPA
jgi:hypothetical protein